MSTPLHRSSNSVDLWFASCQSNWTGEISTQAAALCMLMHALSNTTHSVILVCFGLLCWSHSTGDLSRNRTVGLKLGRGMKLPDIIESMHGAVAEGVLTSHAAHDLAKKLGVEVPIIDGIHSIIHGEGLCKSLWGSAYKQWTLMHALFTNSCLPLCASCGQRWLS